MSRCVHTGPPTVCSTYLCNVLEPAPSGHRCWRFFEIRKWKKHTSASKPPKKSLQHTSRKASSVPPPRPAKPCDRNIVLSSTRLVLKDFANRLSKLPTDSACASDVHPTEMPHQMQPYIAPAQNSTHRLSATCLYEAFATRSPIQSIPLNLKRAQ